MTPDRFIFFMPTSGGKTLDLLGLALDHAVHYERRRIIRSSFEARSTNATVSISAPCRCCSSNQMPLIGYNAILCISTSTVRT